MDYKSHYDRLILRAKNRKLEGYSEKHHVIPRCMGGSDDASNLAELTGAEHFVAHQLLCKMYPKNHSLAHAMKILMGSKNYNNKQFEWVRRKAVETSIIFHTGRKRSQETKDRISKSIKGKRKGVKFTKEHCSNISKAKKGVNSYKFTKEHCSNISKRIITDEWRQKISDSQINRDWSGHSEKIKAGITDETRQKLSELRKNSPKTVCEYCFKEVDAPNYKRWHGPKCKENPNGILGKICPY